jgi:hypothetical protein
MKAARAATRRTIDLYEGDELLHNSDGSLTTQGILVLKGAWANPANHRTVDLGIREFKQYLKRIPMITKGTFNRLVREYKAKAWDDYGDLVKFKGSFPTNNGQYKEEKHVKKQHTNGRKG